MESLRGDVQAYQEKAKWKDTTDGEIANLIANDMSEISGQSKP
jgi:hypothetical protein